MFLADDIQLTAPAPGPVLVSSAQVVGPVGLQTFYYWWVAHYPIGIAVVSAPLLVRSAPSLTPTNYVTVVGQAPPGATSYDLLRTNVPSLPSVTANIAVATGLTSPTFNDQGAAPTAYSLAGLLSGAPVTAHINLNNRDFAQPELVISPYRLAVQGGLAFPDGSSQNTAGSPGITAWSDVTASRSANTVYTNNTAKPICVTVSVQGTATQQTASAIVAGVMVATVDIGSGGTQIIPMTFWVLPGQSYEVTASGMTISRWVEAS